MSALGTWYKLQFYGSFMSTSIHIIILELNTSKECNTAICISNDFDKIKIGNIKFTSKNRGGWNGLQIVAGLGKSYPNMLEQSSTIECLLVYNPPCEQDQSHRGVSITPFYEAILRADRNLSFDTAKRTIHSLKLISICIQIMIKPLWIML